MKPVLLTGATGFIGQRLQKALLKGGKQVEAIVRPNSINKNVLPGVGILPAELSDGERLESAISRACAVIYCAGSVRGRQLQDFTAANITGVRSVVESMNLAGGDTPLLLISSLAASRPQISDYSNSKYLGEQELISNANFPWTIFRPPAVYGPGDKEMLPILKLARKGLVTPTGPEDQRLSLIHVDDVASAMMTWLNAWDQCRSQIFTLHDGHSEGYSWKEIAEIASTGKYRRINIPTRLLTSLASLNLFFSGLLNYSPMLTPGKARELTQPHWVCNNKALSSATGWTPQITLEQGLSELFRPAEKNSV